LPAEIGKLASLTSLNLSNNQLRELSAEIGKLTSLTSLDLSNNQLRNLPSSIGNLTRLSGLYLGRNQLRELPAEIGKLTSLTSLHLSNNQLWKLPSEIGNLTNLTGLWLNENQLREFPSSIGNLTRLSDLILRRNPLRGLPPEIGKLTKLTWLTPGGNHLRELPLEIGNLTSLETLWLFENQLCDLPTDLRAAFDLRHLSVEDAARLNGREAIQRFLSQLRRCAWLVVAPDGGLEVHRLGDISFDSTKSDSTSVDIEGSSINSSVVVAGHGPQIVEPFTIIHDSHFYPVGQGLFFHGRIAEQSRAFSYVFDCGAQQRGQRLSRHIGDCRKVNGSHVNLLVLSHLHWDHVSGLPGLLEKTEIERAVIPYLYPAERLYLASLSGTDIGFQDDPNNDWFGDFMLRPAAFLAERGVKVVSFIRGGDNPDAIPDGQGEHRGREGEGAWDGRQLARREIESIQEAEAEAGTGERLDPRQLFDSHSTAHHGAWCFSFFNANADPAKLDRFRRAFIDVCGRGTLQVALREDSMLKKMRHAYDGIFSAQRLNRTSLAMCCHRLPEPFDTRYTMFTTGVSPESHAGRSCRSDRSDAFCPAFLFTGDLPVNELWASFAWKFGLQSSKHPVVPFVYQVPHHGSRENWSEAQRDTLDQAVFVIGARTVNHYGHPHPEVLRSLAEENRPTFWVTENRGYRHRFEMRVRKG
jgi:glyoxylase-like metal-dependent hydrolase (beta-lactamase superfamily II)